MEVERNASLPFIGVEQLNLAPRIKSKGHVRLTNTVLLLRSLSKPRELSVQALSNYHHVRPSVPHIFQFVVLLTRKGSTWDRLAKLPKEVIQFGCQAIHRFQTISTLHQPKKLHPPSTTVTIPLKYQASANVGKKRHLSSGHLCPEIQANAIQCSL